MTFEEIPSFGITDYCLFVAMLVISSAIGVIMSFKGNKTPEDYLLGSRSFKPLPVAMSLLTSIISSISLLGFSGEAYAYGLQFSLVVAGMILALIFCYYFTLPVLFPLKLTSVNEYIEMRFKSRRLRNFVLFLSIVQGFIIAGIYLYAPTIALSSVTPVDTTSYIYILGVICTLYSAIGGIKAVVYTDVFQLSVVLIGIAVITIIGSINAGGLMNVWEIAKEGGRFDVFRMDLGVYGRHTLPNVVLHGFFYFTALYGASQIYVQRMSCVNTMKDARVVLLSNIVGYLILYFFIFTCGIMCYATYAGCDPLMLKKITKSDQILTYFVIDKLGYIVGLPGLFVAAIVGGALSSVSSVISSQVSMIWKDFLQNLPVIDRVTPQVGAIINKMLSLSVGAAIIGMALWSSQTESILDLNLGVSSGSFGPILGIFILGLFFPKCNTNGAWSGLVTSWAFLCWLVIGGYMYRPKSIPLPVSIDNCSTEITDSISEDFTRSIYTVNIMNQTNLNTAEVLKEDANEQYEFSLMWLYGISPTLYPVIGPILCVIIGLIVSYATGSQNLNEVSPALISPCMRRFYWEQKELLELEKVQQNGCANGINNSQSNGIIKRDSFSNA